MMGRIIYFISLLFILSSCDSSTENRILVASASNVQHAIREIAEVFEDSTKIQIDVISSSSGKLTAQINEGAPFDIFVSADMAYPEFLCEEGFCKLESKVYALGNLVLWQPEYSDSISLTDLGIEKIRRIAIANPKTAPYGKAAKQILENLGIYEGLKSKIVYGENISQTLQFVDSGAADFGFVAESLLLSNNFEGSRRFQSIDKSLYDPIKQSAVLLKNKNRNNGQAEDFYQFIFSEEAALIFKKYGYTIPGL